MPIGTIIHNRQTQYTDPYTGRAITRLTMPDHTSHHMYFYNRMISADGKKLLYSAKLNGVRQLYLMDIPTGDAVQLTEEGGRLDDYGGVLGADDRTVYYQQDAKIWRLDLATLTRQCLYAAAPGWDCNDWGMSEDNRFITIAQTRRDTRPDLTGKKGWEFFPLTCAAKPLCRIVFVNTETGRSNVVVEDRCWFGHAQLRPHDPDTILFCHEGPYDMIDARLWLVQSDGTNYRCVREQPSDLIITHEFWQPDGEAFVYVHRKGEGDAQESIRKMRPGDLKEEIVMPCLPYAHFICDRQQRYMVGDCQGKDTPIHLQAAAGRSEEVPNDFIYLIDVAHKTETPLCYHGTSWTAAHGNPQDAHPHPCFSPDGKKVVFTSDKDGKPCIYQIVL